MKVFHEEMKNTSNGQSRVDLAKERINELEDRPIEINQAAEKSVKTKIFSLTVILTG
jgi:hypothetical protein